MKKSGIAASAIAGLLFGGSVSAQQNTKIAQVFGPGEAQSANQDMAPPSGRVHTGEHDLGEMLNVSRERHQYVRLNDFDAQYAPKRNPHYATESNVVDGEEVYVEHCARCHGVSGVGDGEDGKELKPPPSNIYIFAKTAMATDPYMMWAISEGGAPVASAMPSYDRTLSEGEMWKVILYLRQM